MNFEEKEPLLTKDYCNIINILNKIITKNIKKNKIDNELRKKDYQYFKKIINKDDNYFYRIIEMVINYFLAKINTDCYREYFIFKKERYSGYEYDRIPKNYISASELFEKIIESYSSIAKFNNIYDDAENMAEEIINVKLGIIEEKNDLVFTIEEIEKFSKFNNISNDEKYERLWYILIYIAIHYNVLKHKLYL